MPSDNRPRRAASADVLNALSSRLTKRERLLLSMLYEHRVFTASQIKTMFYGGIRYTTERLRLLYSLRAVDRFRPLLPVGSAPYHYVLDEAGAVVVAALRNTTVAELGYHHKDSMAIAHSGILNHQVGVNGFFADLIGHARAHPGAALTEWLSERRCQHAFAERVHPDGYGRWRDPDSADVAFFAEYDTGSEDLPRVAGKLDAYTRFASTTGKQIPVLFVLPSAAREANLHERLHDTAQNTPFVYVATTSPEAITATTDASPAGACWLPAQRDIGSPRLRLVELADAWPHHTIPTSDPRTSDARPRYAPRRHGADSVSLRRPDAEWPPSGRVLGGRAAERPHWADDEWM
jgi:hypothetical protein